MNHATIRKRLEPLIRKVNHAKGSKTISDGVILFGEDGVLDSVGTIKLIMSVEEEFEITVDEKEIGPKNFKTIAALARFIESKLVGSLALTLAGSLASALSDVIQC
jgi:acyl carrier protein